MSPALEKVIKITHQTGVDWDGHASDEVLKRLFRTLQQNQLFNMDRDTVEQLPSDGPYKEYSVELVLRIMRDTPAELATTVGAIRKTVEAMAGDYQLTCEDISKTSFGITEGKEHVHSR